jgi:hypothetical protein
MLGSLRDRRTANPITLDHLYAALQGRWQADDKLAIFQKDGRGSSRISTLSAIGGFGIIRFLPADMTGIAVNGSEERFMIMLERGSCEFGLTRVKTMRLLTLMFKSLIRDWHIISDMNASRDMRDPITIYTLTDWIPK